jgi:cytochrome P450
MMVGRTSSRLPPGPWLPAVVQMVRYLRDPIGLFDECGARYGDAFTLRLGRRNLVLLATPDLVKTLYQADPEQFRAGEAKASVFGPIVGYTSSLVLDGAAHLRRRRLIQPLFHGERMLAYSGLIRRVTEEQTAVWPTRGDFPAHPTLQQIALESILRSIFGERIDPELPQAIHGLVTTAVGSKLLFLPILQRDLGPRSPWGKVMRVVERMDRAVFAEIERKRARPDGDQTSLLALLLAARDEEGAPLSDRELRDEVVTLVVAGHEITAMSLAWALACILSRRDVRERIEAELETTPDGGEYLDGAIKESMRLHPAVVNGSARILRTPCRMGDYELPASTMLNVCVHLLHRRADLYPEPLAFRPERFIGKKTNPYEWVPFGGGVRRCLGMAFALHEMKIVLATLLAGVRLELASPTVRPARRGAFMAPAGGLRVRVTERRSPGRGRRDEVTLRSDHGLN